MAASDNLAAMEPWVYRPISTPSFADSWISEAFARDTTALTLALQKSLCDNNYRSSESADSEFLPFFDSFVPEATPTVSGVSGSDPESVTAAPKRHHQQRKKNAVPVAGGKVAKRKSRASKRTQTTFITADPANFRQMVQQVTGVRFNGVQQQQQFYSAQTIVKPEPQRPGGARLPCLPTLDTSALLFDHHQQLQRQRQQQQESSSVGPGVGGHYEGPMEYGRRTTVEVAEGGVSGGGLGLDSYSSFPTLESWKVMS